jgi:hypothetical protein
MQSGKKIPTRQIRRARRVQESCTRGKHADRSTHSEKSRKNKILTPYSMYKVYRKAGANRFCFGVTGTEVQDILHIRVNVSTGRV